MKLEGEIGEIQLIERLVELWREQFTGAIRFESDGIIKIIYFKGGDVLSASTNDRADSIDEILMRAGKVTREHVKQALAKRKENETLGDALLNLGFITRKELTWARRVQVVGVIRSIVAWQDGSFTIVADYLPKRDEGTLFPLPQLLVELTVTDQDRQRFERAMDGGAAVFEKAADFDDVFRRLGLNDEAEQIAAQVTGTNSAGDVATLSGKDTFNVYKLLEALAVLGILRRVEQKPQVTPEFSLDDDYSSFANAGMADAADMWADVATPAAPPQPIVTQQPMFDLDEEEALKAPTLEVPITLPDEPVYSAPVPEPDVPAVSEEPVWSAPPAEEAAPTTAKMPVWEDAPARPAVVPIPAPIAPAAAAEEQWGFDEAQIETARRASIPVSSPGTPASKAPAFARGKQPPKKSRDSLLVTILMLVVLGAAAYYGYRWWQGQQKKAAPVATATVQPRPAPVRPAETGTMVPVGTTATDTTGTTTAAAATTDTTSTTGTFATTTTEPPAPPVTATTATVASATTTAAVPPRPAPTVVTPAPAPVNAGDDALRARYDAMAADYAQEKSGNFTVQFAIFCQPSSVRNALNAGAANVWFLKHGARCYRAYYGRYGTREEAQRALAGLPPSLRDAAARVVAVPK